MIKQLYVQNFALAETLNVEFHAGLNIITGETGAGKSILVGAISAVLGGRIFTEIVRTGAERATVEAVFQIEGNKPVQTLLSEKELAGGTELFLRREILTRGSTRAFVNDTPVAIATLAEIGDMLVDIHGQHEHQSLLQREIHRYFLDAYGRLNPLLQQVSLAFQEAQETEKKLRQLSSRQQALEEKQELHRFQLKEIADADPRTGEDDELEEERSLLINMEKIFSLSARFAELMEGNSEFNLQDQMGHALQILEEISEFSAPLKKLCEEFASAKIVVSEAARSVEEFQNGLEFNPRRLEEVEQRLSALSLLKKKYGGTLQAVLEYRREIQKELELRDNFQFELENLHKNFNQKKIKYSEWALKLSRQRQQVAVSLEKAITERLDELGMPATRFRVDFSRSEDSSGFYEENGSSYFGDELGIDRVEFLISPNPGEDFKPLAKIVSGGEMSRIMLALKNILAGIDRIPLLIFDEIDAGVSGRIAQSVGRSIRQLANSHQIICITHLPQIASQGQNQYRVAKFTQNGRTFTQIVHLSEQERIEEIARLISGEKMTPEIMQSAEQLIQEARRGGKP
ncbi:MAG: DNA repair protein RecN [Calditrichia bacterium]